MKWTSKRYEACSPWPIFNNELFREWEMKEFRKGILSRKEGEAPPALRLRSDNRKRFREALGKPDFCYRGSYYYHCWVFEFEGDTFIVMTAKEKGTCIEKVGGIDYSKAEGKKCIRFVKDLLKKIES